MMKRRAFLLTACSSVAGLLVTKALADEQIQSRPIKFKFARKVPETVSELYAAMNSVFPVGPSTEICWSVTGEEYEEYIIAVNLRQCIQFGIDPEAIACKTTWQHFLRKSIQFDLDTANNPMETKIYWRTKPEYVEYQNQTSYGLDWDGSFEEPKARLYMRYLISSSPQISRSGDLHIYTPA